MLDFIFKPIIAGITAIGITIGGLFGMVQDNSIADLQKKIESYEQQLQELQLQIDNSQQTLGSYYSVGGKYYRLWGNGITSSATSLVLTSFKSPINDIEFKMADFGEVGYGVIEPDNTSNIEIISFRGITQESTSDKATLTGVDRGLNFVYPYNASTTLAKQHAGGSRFIISDPPVHFSEFPAKRNTESIWGDWTFSATTTPQYNQAPSFTGGSQEFATVKFAEDQANAGAAVSSTSTKGIVTIGTSNQRINFTTTTYDGGQLVIRLWDFATSTDKHGATTTPMMTDTDGKMSQLFLDRDESLTWNGTTTFATTTITNTLRVNASTTLMATTTIGDASTDYLWVNASSTFQNTTTTFDRPLQILDGANASSSDPYSLATQNYVISKTMKFPGSTATTSDGTQGNWVNVNISSIVGANKAMVYLKAAKTGGSSIIYCFKTTGENDPPVTGASPRCDNLDNNQTSNFWVLTDTSGRFAMYTAGTGANGSTVVTVEMFSK